MNIYDIAEQANVSIATVSRVINGGSVKRDTRERIERIMKENNFLPRSASKRASDIDDNNIAILIPDISNPFFSMLLSGMSATADQYGYNVFLFGTDENVEREHRFLHAVKDQKLKGLIVIAVSDEDEETARLLTELENNHMPIVLLDRDVKNANFDRVFSDDYGGSVAAVEALISAGHTRIATIYGPKTSRPGLQRFNGYVNTMKSHGIALQNEYMLPGYFRQKPAYEAIEKLMSLPEPPTAIFCSNNLTTLGCLQYINEHGLVVGKDISLIGFDEIETLRAINYNISVVDRSVFRMGQEAINMLNIRIQGKVDYPIAHHRVVVDTCLVLRGSEKYNPD